MMPVGPLMIEHRLITRMIKLIEAKVEEIDLTGKVDVPFIDTAVDFIRNYADHCHHGKEEGILFRALAEKAISAEHEATMTDLINEHIWGREVVANLIDARNRYAGGDLAALVDIRSLLIRISEFYPRHIHKEEDDFFVPIMAYFSEEEKAEMLARGEAFDDEGIHEKYKRIVENLGG